MLFFSPPPQGKPFSITIIQAYTPTTDVKEAQVDWFSEELQDIELTHIHTKNVTFIIGDWNEEVESQGIRGITSLTLEYKLKQGKGLHSMHSM